MEDIDISRWAGPSYVLDLRDVGPNQAVTGTLLEERGREVRRRWIPHGLVARFRD